MNMPDFWKSHKWTILLVAFGLVLAILLMTIGFWKSLLVIVLVAVCFLIGYLLDKDGVDGVRDFFKKLFSSSKGND